MEREIELTNSKIAIHFLSKYRYRAIQKFCLPSGPISVADAFNFESTNVFELLEYCH